jgi:xanthine/uracil/vitamin C permease (AzgA family)
LLPVVAFMIGRDARRLFLARTPFRPARGTNARTEAIAKAVTFLTMVYIVVVNPAILADAGLPREATGLACSATVSATTPACVGRLLPCSTTLLQRGNGHSRQRVPVGA